jgi:hypothetical protein
MDKKHSEQKSILELHADSPESVSASWTALHALTEHWQSDLKFFEDELNFLNIVTDKYLLKLIEEDNVSRIAPLSMALANLEKRNRALTEKVLKHLQHIRESIQNSVSQDEQAFKDAHVELENDLIDFVKVFRITKKEIFDSAEQVLKSEKAKRLLNP